MLINEMENNVQKGKEYADWVYQDTEKACQQVGRMILGKREFIWTEAGWRVSKNQPSLVDFIRRRSI